MLGPGRCTQFTQAGGNVAIETGTVVLLSVTLTPAAAASTCNIREGGTGGTIVLSLSAAANGPSTVHDVPMSIKDPAVTDIVGAGSTVNVVR